jgi:hypothetical protein
MSYARLSHRLFNPAPPVAELTYGALIVAGGYFALLFLLTSR